MDNRTTRLIIAVAPVVPEAKADNCDHVDRLKDGANCKLKNQYNTDISVLHDNSEGLTRQWIEWQKAITKKQKAFPI